MSALYTVLLESETKESLAKLLVEEREKNRRLLAIYKDFRAEVFRAWMAAVRAIP